MTEEPKVDSKVRDEDFDSIISDSQDQVKKSQSRITLVAVALIVFGAGVIAASLFTPIFAAEILGAIKVFAIGFSSLVVIMGVALLVMRMIADKQQKKQQSDAEKE